MQRGTNQNLKEAVHISSAGVEPPALFHEGFASNSFRSMALYSISAAAVARTHFPQVKDTISPSVYWFYISHHVYTKSLSRNRLLNLIKMANVVSNRSIYLVTVVYVVTRVG